MYPPKPHPSTSLRRPSVAVAGIRSASFSDAITTETVSPLKRCRAISTCTPKARAPRKQPRTITTLVPTRSCWGGHPRRRARVGWRLPIHKPDCKWMRSSQHPQVTPRDKDCPACQDAEKRPEELSPSELWWERRMQRFRDAVDKDAYDTIFGWSNDMLRGRPLTPRWFWEDEIKPWSLKGMQEDPLKGFKERILHTGSIFDDIQDPSPKKPRAAAEPEHAQQPPTATGKALAAADVRPTKKVKTEAEPAKDIPVKQPHQQQKVSSSHIKAHSSWSYKSVNSSGQTIERSGASTYDPISGRMVPVQPTTMAPKVPPAAAKPQTPAGASSQTSPPSPLEGRRIALYDKAENSLVEAQKSVTSLRTTHLADQKPSSLHDTEPRALALTHSRLQSTQVALKDYKHSITSIAGAKRDSTAPKTITVEDLLKEFGLGKKASLESSWRSEQQRKTSLTTAPAHFRQREDEALTASAAGVAKLAYNALHRRRGVPLKHMSAHELGLHRQHLVEAWARQQKERSETQAKSKTAADQRLEREVEALKTQHAAWESTWSQSRSSAKSKAAPAPCEAKPEPVTAEMTGGEGDMCPNVAKFCNPDRMYKRKAPHALMAEDPELAQKIKKIYEEAHGTIDENHRQSKPAFTQRSLDQYEVQGIQQEVENLEQDRAAKRVKTEKPQLDSKVQQNLAASHTQANEVRKATQATTEGAEAEAIKAYEAGTARKGLPTALDRHSRQASSSGAAAKDSSAVVQKPETSVTSTTRTSSPEAALFRLVKYDEATGRTEETPASSHPDKWSMPRLSANTAFEMLRDKIGYQQHLVPLMQQLRRNGYVLYDLARDDKTILFVRQPTTVSTIAPHKTTTFSTASSRGYPSMLHGKGATTEATSTTSVMSAVPRRQTTNPVDPSLRPQFPQTQTGNFASPTGYVNLEAPEAGTSQATPASTEPASSEKIWTDKSLYYATPTNDPSPNAERKTFAMLDEQPLMSATASTSTSEPPKQPVSKPRCDQPKPSQQTHHTNFDQSKQKISKEEPVFSGTHRSKRSRSKSPNSKSSTSSSSSDTESDRPSEFWLKLEGAANLVIAIPALAMAAYFYGDWKEKQAERERADERRISWERRKEEVLGLLWDEGSATEADAAGGKTIGSKAADAASRAHRRNVKDAKAVEERAVKQPKEQSMQSDARTEGRKRSLERAARLDPEGSIAKELHRRRVTEALADVTMMSLSLGVVAWVFLKMLERGGRK